MKRCLFCNRILRPKKAESGGKTDEHTIPLWLQRHLGIKENVVTPSWVRTDNRTVIDTRQHVMASFKAGVVCSECNEGWMHDLEDAVKSILIRLIDNPHLLTKLSEDDRFTTARCALKRLLC